MTLQIRPSILLRPDGATCLGSDASCSPPLPHPLVASRHAEMTIGPGKPSLRDLGTGTFVNGQLVSGRQVYLDIGDQIDIGPYAFVFTGNALEALSSMDSVQITATELCRNVSAWGGERPILQDVSLVFQPGEFVCLLGPSGCGKSTLMAALSGRARPTSGTVRVNHRDLYTHFEAVKKHMVLVPQQPLLHDGLTVNEALRYTARLRLPSSVDRVEAVDQMIKAMLLEQHRNHPINNLSGGQQKRVSLANELLADPGLIFIDEVTSGLDENIDGEMMQLFRGLANRGKTVICITHTLVHVPETCDLVVFLAPGGRLAFVGPPEAARSYFNTAKLGDIYGMLDETNAERWAKQFLASTAYATYVKSRLPDTEGAVKPKSCPPRALMVHLPTEVKTVAYQSVQLTMRQIILLWRDLPSLGSLLGQVFLVAAILGLAFGEIGKFPADGHANDARMKLFRENGGLDDAIKKRIDYVRKVMNLTFLIAVTCFWFGCNNAAREIVRERSITMQERHFNLRPFAYYFSKLLILTAISWLQVSLLIALVWYFCDPPQSPTECMPLLLALALAGTTLGLFLSSVAPSEQVAITLIPIAIIPQIVLSSSIVKLESVADAIGKVLVSTYWGKRGMDGLLTGDPGVFARTAHDKLIEASGMRTPLLVILIHAAVFALLTLAALSTDGTLGGTAEKIKTWSSWLLRFGRNKS